MNLLFTERTYPIGKQVSADVLFGHRLVALKNPSLDVKQTNAYCGQYGFISTHLASQQEHYDFH